MCPRTAQQSLQLTVFRICATLLADESPATTPYLLLEVQEARSSYCSPALGPRPSNEPYLWTDDVRPSCLSRSNNRRVVCWLATPSPSCETRLTHFVFRDSACIGVSGSAHCILSGLYLRSTPRLYGATSMQTITFFWNYRQDARWLKIAVCLSSVPLSKALMNCHRYCFCGSYSTFCDTMSLNIADII